MKAVLAFRGGDDGEEALALGATLRRTTQAELIVAAVLPPVSDKPGVDRVDLEYRNWLNSVASQAHQEAGAYLSPDDPSAIDFHRVSAASVGSGLAHLAESTQADVLILGCAKAATESSFLTGSVAERLLHSSPVPLLMAPHGYIDDGSTFGSLTCAYAGTDRSRESLAAACELVNRFDVTLRVATFVPRAATMYPPEVGFDAEDMVSAEFAEQAVGMHEEAVAFCRAAGVTEVETVVGRGRGWAGALTSIPWEPHDVLVFGSSRLGPLARVFLGSTASKIMRHSPVPVLVVPAGTTIWSE